MGAPEDGRAKVNQREPVWFPEPESMIETKESLSSDQQFFTQGHRAVENRQICCESRIYDAIESAACDCHGDSCCC